MEVEREAFDIKGFCQAYSISRAQVFKELKAGNLTRIKVGSRKTLISRRDAERWLESRVEDQKMKRRANAA